MKATISSEGKGIELFDSNEIEISQFWEKIKDQKVVLESFIVQHPKLSEINPSSVNTIRIITAVKNRKVCIVGAVLRVGGKDAFVDNFCAGGFGYPIDINTGVITGRGVSLNTSEKVICHPSMGILMLGMKIPNWNYVKETVKDVALSIKNVKYIAWDIAVLKEGCELIEANVNYPTTEIIQLDSFDAYRKLINFMNERE